MNPKFWFSCFIFFGLLGSFSFAVAVITAIGGWNPGVIQPQYYQQVILAAVLLLALSVSGFYWTVVRK